MSSNTAALFDIDGTLTQVRTWKGYIEYFRRRKIKRTTHLAFLAVHYPLYFLHRLGLISASGFRRPWASHLAWYVRGFTQDNARPIWDAALQSLKGAWQTETRRMLEDHLKSGDLVMLVSSGPLPMVERIAAELCVEHYIGTRFEIQNGVYTGRCLHPIVIDETKAITALAYLNEKNFPIDLQASFAYADSTTDLSLLEMVGNPVAAYPDGGLQEIAIQRGWRIVA